MTDLRDLLDSAAGPATSPAPDLVAADRRRGRRALLQRRWARSGAVALAGAAAVTALAVAPGYLGGDSADRVVTPASGQQEDPANPGVDLVGYDGALHGAAFRPAEVPTGWTVSGEDSYLLVGPPGSKPTDQDGFVGKVLVYIQKDMPPNESLPEDAEVAVGDRTGYANRSDASGLQVWVPRSDGTQLRAQAPHSLGWDEATLGRFLGGITVLPGATGTVG